MCQRIRDCRMFNPKWDIYVTPSLLKTWGLLWKRKQKNRRAVGGRWLQEKCLLDTAGQLYVWTHSSWHSLYKTSEGLTISNAIMKREGRHKIPPLAEELLATDSCCKRVSSLWGCPLVDQPSSSKRPHIQEWMGVQTTFTRLQKRRCTKLNGLVGTNLWGVEGRCEKWSKHIVQNSQRSNIF